MQSSWDRPAGNLKDSGPSVKMFWPFTVGISGCTNFSLFMENFVGVSAPYK